MTREDQRDILGAKWKMFYKGAWRPVTRLIAGPQRVDNPSRAAACVLYCHGDPEGEWVAIVINSPGEILARKPGEALEALPWRMRQSAEPTFWERVA